MKKPSLAPTDSDGKAKLTVKVRDTNKDLTTETKSGSTFPRTTGSSSPRKSAHPIDRPGVYNHDPARFGPVLVVIRRDSGRPARFVSSELGGRCTET